MNGKRTYFGYGIIIVVSVAAASLLRFSELIRDLAAIPAIISLFAALFQVARDRIAHERSLLVLESQNSFSMGATSHMAGVAFDKYSSFCEEYVAEMFRALTTLTREGPRMTALEHASNLATIRRKWAIWLTPAIENALAPFEMALRTIGANAYVLREVPGSGAHLQEMYATFAEVTGLEKWEDKPLTGDLTVSAVIDRLRRVLGTEELSLLRGKLVTRALSNIADCG